MGTSRSRRHVWLRRHAAGHAWADLGVLFMHNEGFSTMCGHGIIGVTHVAIETGLLPGPAPASVKIDTPAGLVTAHPRVANGHVTSVCFQNVPSFVIALDQTIDVPGIGSIRYDIAFGGAFYAYVNVRDVGLTCVPRDLPRLIEKGMAIKNAIMGARDIPHPYEPDLSFLYGTIFVGPPLGQGTHSRNVCIFANGEVDRSPTGTGVSGRLALHFARGEIRVGERILVESIIGTHFAGRVVETTTFGTLRGDHSRGRRTAHITGRHEFLIDPNDPLRDGFVLR